MKYYLKAELNAALLFALGAPFRAQLLGICYSKSNLQWGGFFLINGLSYTINKHW
jgi:hypothetical protein